MLIAAQNVVSQTVDTITEQILLTEQSIQDTQLELRQAHSSEAVHLAQNILSLRKRILIGLEEAHDSPFFARCDVQLKTEDKSKILYFGKFSIPELNIYSWTVPAARIRFNKPGPFAYTSETQNKVSGEMERIDQYLIAQGKIRLMTTETQENPRTLVHQEKFSIHKTEFMLPEIVERMEKAQDDIIRANAYGSFFISGPAGSGKTTLALHRIAYLLQAPEHNTEFDPRKILILVQDDRSKEYFEKLLPSLGITNIGISTFYLWAMDLLDITTCSYVQRFGKSESERDLYEAAKYKAFQNLISVRIKNPFETLKKHYFPHFSNSQKNLFSIQCSEGVLDKFDLTLLLLAHKHIKGSFTKRQRTYTRTLKDTVKTRMEDVEVKYSSIVIDEVQNYLPEQIRVLQSCISEKTKAMTYVGDLAQQTSLFALRDWSHVNEQFASDRIIYLDKVYRSTKQILQYIQSSGFKIGIPQGIHEGDSVHEFTLSQIEITGKIMDLLPNLKGKFICIIGLEKEDVEPYARLETHYCKIMTATEAQGLEFDTVIFIHRKNNMDLEYPETLRSEKKKVINDQIYVALTRAMNELYVFNLTSNDRI